MTELQLALWFDNKLLIHHAEYYIFPNLDERRTDDVFNGPETEKYRTAPFNFALNISH